jgi:Na+-transporting NADH:ubiquinone oxidoreductase subunit C
MNTNKNSYTLIYATVMVVIVALTLAIVSSSLKAKQDENKRLDKMKQILSSLNVDLEGKNVSDVFNSTITQQIVVNSKGEVLTNPKVEAFKIDIKKELAKSLEMRELPVYIANINGESKYIFSLYGAGLWGPIWGYIALDADKNTVYGTFFSHASETPGLGAEISLPNFQQQFTSKKIMNENNDFVSIAILKAGQNVDGMDKVDAISGGTITSKGVEDMLKNCIGQYEMYLKLTEGGNE